MKITSRILQVIMLLGFCSSVSFAQQTKAKAPAPGTRVYENLINLSKQEPIIQAMVTANSSIISFPDKKNYILTGKAINLITAAQLQRLSTSAGNSKRTALISAELKDLKTGAIVWQTNSAERLIELPAALPEGTYELQTRILEKAVTGSNHTLRNEAKMNLVKEKGTITMIMEESQVN